MLQPVRTKWRKAHKGRIHGTATRASVINYGSFALKALQPERITGKQIEAARVALTRHMKRQGRVWTRIFPNIPVSKKPIEVRMGTGTGNPEFFACRVKPGRILFEVDGVSEQIAKEALYKASAKLPIKTKTIKRVA
jgi:large subunit ribosomal protein L16